MLQAQSYICFASTLHSLTEYVLVEELSAILSVAAQSDGQHERQLTGQIEKAGLPYTGYCSFKEIIKHNKIQKYIFFMWPVYCAK